MFKFIEFKIAARYLRAKKQNKFVSIIAGFSIIGIIIGVAALIVVMSVMNGFHKELVSKMLGFNSAITIQSFDQSISNYQEITKKIKDNQEIKSYAPVVESQIMINYKNNNFGIISRGIDFDDLMQKNIDNINAKKQDFAGPALIIGEALAFNLGVNIGDQVNIISPKGMTTILGNVPRIQTFKIIGTFSSGMSQYDANIIFMPLEYAQKFFQLIDKVTAIEIDLIHPEHSVALITKIYEALEGEMRVIDWQTSNFSLLHALKVEQSVMFLILTLIIIVAAFNIISSLIMLVRDKYQDIAILRTMGATQSSILRIFLICGLTIGSFGTFVGFIIGTSFALNIEKIRKFLENFTGASLFDPLVYYLAELPSDLHISDIIKIVSISILVSLLATIPSAYRAAKLDPIRGLRDE